MSEQENIISVTIFDREYPIKCPPDEAHVLVESAKAVDEKMRSLRQSSGKTSADRIAIVTALNLCRELITLKQQHNTHDEKNNQHVSEMLQRIQNILAAEDQIAV
ncbi:MAG: cell division protein ZapA [Gammaproteobacteria bacterium]|nr:cell division protein ZapA [Gammaproteobacteria bacterium]MCH9745063.1 cell division protein ZapA [Gammaproteobacteria bacterium]